MNTSVQTSSSTLKHARYLADTIGPRGSTTPQEAQAAEYAYQMMEDAGLEPVKETFASARSAWRPYALASALALAAEFLFLFAGQAGAVLASLIMIFVIVSVLLEMVFENNPLRWFLPKGQSQNVWAKISPSGQLKRRVLIVGHLDSHRTPKVFSTLAWLRIFKWLIPVGLTAMVLITLLFIIGIFSSWGGWRSFSVLLAIVAWWLSVLTFEADYTPFTAGAMDNATGAGMVLSVAAQLKKQPLQNTEVWAVCTGCEEVGCYGAADLITRHKAELKPAESNPSDIYFITLDSVGGSNTRPCYISRHTFITTAQSDAELLRLANQVAARRSELGARSVTLSGAYTEGHVAAKAGLRLLTFVNLRKDGIMPHWHQPTDVFANIDGAVVQDTETFLHELLREIDEA